MNAPWLIPAWIIGASALAIVLSSFFGGTRRD